MAVVLTMSHPGPAVTAQTRPGTRPQRSPPRNQQGEIVCMHDECKEDQPIFKRPCEFNKHMDKHERPYKCSNAACKKNPGFTYAGGLLRHQREVHNMHRTKEPFYCPHSSCNRSTGPGFSRRENLEEHLRRRHSGISVDDTTDTTVSDFGMRRIEPLPPDRKRRADTGADDSGGGLDQMGDRFSARINSLQQENERLRAELHNKDRLLAEMSQDNKRLREMLAPPTPIPPHSIYHHRSPLV